MVNSEDETFVWEPQTNYDRPSTYSGGGFLHQLDPDLVAVLGTVDKQVNRNTVAEDGGQDLFSDKVFLLSRVEVYGGMRERLAAKPLSLLREFGVKPHNSRFGWQNQILRCFSPSLVVAFSAPCAQHREREYRWVREQHYALYSFGAAPACTII